SRSTNGAVRATTSASASRRPNVPRSSAASTRPGSRARSATTRSRSACSSRIPTAGFSRRSRTGRAKAPSPADRPAAARCSAVRRVLVVAAAVGIAVIALAVVAVVRSGGSGGETGRTGAGHEITRNDLELTVEHFHEEADREGRPFPAKGTGEYKGVEKIALGLLID